MSNKNQETIADIVSEMRIGDLWASDNAARSMYINDFLTSYADRIEAAWKLEREAGAEAAKDAEIAELRECLREAVREKCPFTRMSCRYGEQCDYECGTEKWRKVLEGAINDK